MFNRKSVSHRRQATVVFGYDTHDLEKREKRIEQYNSETNKCKNISIYSLIVILEDLNPCFFSILKCSKDLLRITKKYNNSASVFSKSFDEFSINYSLQIKNNKISLSSDKIVLFKCDDLSLFTLKEIAVQIIEKINDNFYSEIELSDYLMIKAQRINNLLKKFCQNNHIHFENIDYKDITRKEILNKEVNVKFKMNGLFIDEYIDLYVNKESFNMLKDILKSKYAVKEAEKINNLLKESGVTRENQNKKRM